MQRVGGQSAQKQSVGRVLATGGSFDHDGQYSNTSHPTR